MSIKGNNVVVYTAIFGDYDVLINPRNPNQNIDYICFTDDNNLNSEVWTIRQFNREQLSDTLKNRKVKILPHKFLHSYNYSVYVDGNIHITDDIKDLIEQYVDHDFAAPTHYLRDCIYDEVEVCIKQGKGDADIIYQQIERYKAEGFPENYGLSANSVLFRNHHGPDVRTLMEAWWDEVNNWSSRDQLSLPYMAWKHNFDIKLIDEGPRLGSDYFQRHPHLPQNPIKPLYKFWIYTSANYDQHIAYAIPYYGVQVINKARKDGLFDLMMAVIKHIFPQLYDRILVMGDNYGFVSPDMVYGREYYAKRRREPFRSEAHQIAKVLREEFQPESVIDFGCAVGSYLEPFFESGITIKGVEGNRAALELAVIPQELVEQHDLRTLYHPEAEYDLVLSIEVAEHLPEKYADVFVTNLTSAGSTIVMTAAPPGQDGTHHVNEQPRDYWISKFENYGFIYDSRTVERLRSNIEELNIKTFSHVSKNLFVFRQDG